MRKICLTVSAALVAATAVVGVPALAAPPPPPPNPIAVMPLGDSMTLGITAVGTTPQGGPKFEATDGYRVPLWNRLMDEARFGVDFVGSCPRPKWDGFKCNKGPKQTALDYEHEGHSGFRAHQLFAFVPEWMATYRPKIVLLMVGTNDLCDTCDWQHAPNRLSYLVNLVRDRLPEGGHLFVASVPRRGDAGADRVDWYNQQVPGVVAAKNDGRLHFVPQHLVGAEPEDFSTDRVHPSACGYEKIAWVWYYYLRQELKKDWPLRDSPFDNHGACT